MISTTKRPPLVQDLRNHSAEQVSELRLLLEQGAPTKADPRRPGFFELQGLQNVFYVFKYPTGTKVLLLGRVGTRSGRGNGGLQLLLFRVRIS